MHDSRDTRISCNFRQQPCIEAAQSRLPPPPTAAQVQQVLGEVMLKTLQEKEERLDDELHKMERMEEDDFEELRRQRMEALKKSAEQRAKWKAAGHGEYSEIHDQKTFFEELKKSDRAVVHFYRSSTARCEIVDMHLGKLARKHPETRFVKVNAEKAPFLCERLKIWALPTMVLVKEGKTHHSIVGFEDMGGKDDFPTGVLEEVLLGHEIVLEEYC